MFPTVFQTSSIQKGIGTIASAKLFINETALSDINDFQFFLSADGGSNWDQVTNNVTVNFTNTGTDLRLQILGNSGAYIKVKQTDGSDYPINVFANPTE